MSSWQYYLSDSVSEIHGGKATWNSTRFTVLMRLVHTEKTFIQVTILWERSVHRHKSSKIMSYGHVLCKCLWKPQYETCCSDWYSQNHDRLKVLKQMGIFIISARKNHEWIKILKIGFIRSLCQKFTLS
jgi:hypothetical protein